MLAQPHANLVVESWLEVAEANRGTEGFQVSRAAFQEIVSGRMPSIAEVAGTVGMSVDDLEALVDEMVSEGRLTLDRSRGTITGAGGLSLVESRHELHMLGRQYWVWCALDAVGIPAGLDADARVRSRCVNTGEAVEIDISSGEVDEIHPSEPVISLVSPTLARSLHDCCCSEIGFFASADRVALPAVPITVQQAMDLGRQLWRDGVPL